MDVVPSVLRLMWDGWEKRQRFAFLRFCLVATISKLIIGQRATHLHHKTWTSVGPISLDQQGLLGYSSPQYHLLFYIGYLSRPSLSLFYIHHIPYSTRLPFVRCHTQPICLLSFCAIVFSLCHHTWIYDLPSSAMFRVMRRRKFGTIS